MFAHKVAHGPPWRPSWIQWRLLAGLILSLVIFGMAVGGSVAKPNEYQLGSGDKILVIVYGQENMSGKFSIAGNGNISLPFIGSIKAGGLTVRELQTAIMNRLRPDYLKNPRVSVEVLNFRPFDIIGEVKKPGSYPYRSGMTVINAVAMAGGFTYRAKENGFRIKRATTGTSVKAKRNTVVLPGDVIEILERWF